MQIDVNQLTIAPGSLISLANTSWDKFEAILDELGETRGLKLAYDQGVLELMSPLLEHEFDKEMLGDFIKVLLEEYGIEFISAGSTTFKHEKMAKGIEADHCFYIQNEQLIRGKSRIDLNIDPPPDLAVEIDITSHSHLSLYESLGVPELWRFDGQQFFIYVLNDSTYKEVEFSPLFSSLPLRTILPSYLQASKEQGRNKIIRQFRVWVIEQIQNKR